MKKTCCLFLPLLLLVLFSCNKDNNKNIPMTESGYLIFGNFHGFCTGDCTTLYKLENKQLFADDLKHGLPDKIPFQETPLSDGAYQKAKVLLDNFPADLLNTDKDVYGCPDCADQGGYYLELKKDGKTRKWKIDTFDDEQSQAIINFKAQIEQLLTKL